MPGSPLDAEQRRSLIDTMPRIIHGLLTTAEPMIDETVETDAELLMALQNAYVAAERWRFEKLAKFVEPERSEGQKT